VSNGVPMLESSVLFGVIKRALTEKKAYSSIGVESRVYYTTGDTMTSAVTVMCPAIHSGFDGVSIRTEWAWLQGSGLPWRPIVATSDCVGHGRFTGLIPGERGGDAWIGAPFRGV
jgi:hypothetical protein